MSVQNFVDLLQDIGLVVLTIWVACLRGELRYATCGIRDGIENDCEILPWTYVDRDTGRRFLVTNLSSTRRCGSTILRTIAGGTAYWLDELPVRISSISRFQTKRKDDVHEDPR